MENRMTREALATCVGQKFGIVFNERSVEAELIDVSSARGKAAEDGRKEPFSIVLRTSVDEVHPQAIYQVTHKTLGDNAIFLVPIGLDKQGMRYEAVFT